jgi:hypothetical protein
MPAFGAKMMQSDAPRYRELGRPSDQHAVRVARWLEIVLVDRRITIPIMAAVAVAAVVLAVSQLGGASGSGSVRAGAGNRTPLPTESSPGVPWPVTTAAMPPACTIGGMRVRVVTTAVQRAGSVIVRRIRAASHPCSLSTGGWPAVRLHLANGATPVAKAFPYRPAVAANPTPFVTFLRGGTQRTAVVLGYGRSADIVLFSARVPGQACYRADRAMIFPSVLETGASLQVPVGRPAYQCSSLATFTYLSSRVGGRALAFGQHALTDVCSCSAGTRRWAFAGATSDAAPTSERRASICAADRSKALSAARPAMPARRSAPGTCRTSATVPRRPRRSSPEPR